MPLTRRKVLLASALSAAGAWALKPKSQGHNHNSYFDALNQLLRREGPGKPCLIIDRARLNRNIDTLMSHIGGRFHYRIVAKSLPSIAMLAHVMARTGSHRLMLFHQPYLNAVVQALPNADILMGKPMPVRAAQIFYQRWSRAQTTFVPTRQLQWLIDSPTRLAEYGALAQSLGQTLNVNLEIDVGLHRGGIDDTTTLATMIDHIAAHPHLRLSGLMGYEPHIVKLPGSARYWQSRAMTSYRDAVHTLQRKTAPEAFAQLTLNCGGSPTYQLYEGDDYPFNELSAGSCLVKPTDFDLPTLVDHLAASFIATPVLKHSDQTRIPGINLGSLQAAWDPNKAQTFFTYGGYWKARPESPKGLSTNNLYGRSTNQEMLNGAKEIALRVDDWIFLRPNQSEFVFLQFGDLLVVEDNHLQDSWPCFTEQKHV